MACVGFGEPSCGLYGAECPGKAEPVTAFSCS